MTSYYDGVGLGLGQLGAAADRVPAMSPLTTLGQNGTESWWAASGPIQKTMYIAGLAAVPALAYHGYKRNNSVGWALVWGIFGSWVWPITVPVAFAQGYAKPSRVKSNRRRRPSRSRRRTSRRPPRRTSRRR